MKLFVNHQTRSMVRSTSSIRLFGGCPTPILLPEHLIVWRSYLEDIKTHYKNLLYIRETSDQISRQLYGIVERTDPKRFQIIQCTYTIL